MKKMVSLCFSLLLSANLAFSAQYYCESSGFVGTYTPGGRGCEKWKNSWGENSEKYKNCLLADQKAENAFKSGKCERIVIKRYTKSGKSCYGYYTKKSNKFISETCTENKQQGSAQTLKWLEQTFK